MNSFHHFTRCLHNYYKGVLPKPPLAAPSLWRMSSAWKNASNLKRYWHFQTADCWLQSHTEILFHYKSFLSYQSSLESTFKRDFEECTKKPSKLFLTGSVKILRLNIHCGYKKNECGISWNHMFHIWKMAIIVAQHQFVQCQIRQGMDFHYSVKAQYV